MAMQNPNDNSDNLNIDDSDQSDALRRIMLKLKESGMLTHVPDEMGDVEENVALSQPSVTESQPLAQASDPEPDDKTIVSRPKPESPTVASTDDVEQHADERAKWAAVMSGWDDTGDIAPPTIPSRNQTTQTDASWDSPTQESPETAIEAQSAVTMRRKEIIPQPEPVTALTDSRDETPWTLQQFFDGEIDLEQELLKRHQTVPAMTTFKTRTLGMNSSREVATLTTQDNSAQIIVDADFASKVVQFSFTYGSMMTLRFVLRDIPANARDRWLELMRREGGGLAMLWNENRWRDDYLICVSRDYSTNIFAFSPRNFESAVRLTKETTNQLLDWLEKVWSSDPEPDDEDDSPLLTW
ncbi:MAG: hypothetical protein AAF846_07645 [Chloroflexota bacterium]